MKHAFLIAAHHQFEIMMCTLKLLDDENVDFYIHVDKKVKLFPKKEIESCCRRSKIYWVDACVVNWGGYSQIQCTLKMLNAAIEGEYDYYHYISGVDLPIKTKREILSFFEGIPKKQFIHFESKEIKAKYLDRLRFHSFFQDTRYKKLWIVDKCIRAIERVIGYSRLEKDIVYQYGTNWFSVTHAFAKYILEKKYWIKKVFSNTRCGDELLMQTLVINSPFCNELSNDDFDDNYLSCMRYMDWKRGNPYIFRREDFDDLIKSPYLFARKFDMKVDSEIVDKLYEFLSR